MSDEHRDWNPPRSESPRGHYSAGRWLISERYVIGWEDGVVKIGTTWNGRSRWGQFINRGGIMLDRARYEGLGYGLEAEVWLERQIRKAGYRRAFQHKEDSLEHMGKWGAGWLECYAIPVEDWPALIELARREDALV